jgi:hypothetical protein
MAERDSRLGMKDAGATGRLWRRWADIVGPGVAAHAEPTSLRAGVLRVRADSPAWATEIAYLAEEIRNRASAVVGAPLIAEVRVWTAPGPVSGEGFEAPVGASAGAQREALPDDPATALQRARRAWERRRRGSRGPPQSG